MIAVGTKAPEFTLSSGISDEISLKDCRGKRVILVFYPADWSPVCGDQLIIYNEMLHIFDNYNAMILAISVDGRWCHASYTEHRNIEFPLLADFEPKGAVARKFGVYDESKGECKRALFILDEDGIVAWNYLSPIDVNPGADGILAALDKFSS
jgi:peroxiredoxin